MELGGELDQHQSRIGDDRQQHLAQAFRLVAGRDDIQRSEPQQFRADACRRRSSQRRRLFDRQRVRFEQREQHRAGQDVLVVRQLRDDVDDGAPASDGTFVARELCETHEHVGDLALTAHGAV